MPAFNQFAPYLDPSIGLEVARPPTTCRRSIIVTSNLLGWLARVAAQDCGNYRVVSIDSLEQGHFNRSRSRTIPAAPAPIIKTLFFLLLDPASEAILLACCGIISYIFLNL